MHIHVDTFNLEHIKVILDHSKLARNSRTAHHRMKWTKFGILGIHVVATWVLLVLTSVEVILASVYAFFSVKCTIVHYVICVH